LGRYEPGVVPDQGIFPVRVLRDGVAKLPLAATHFCVPNLNKEFFYTTKNIGKLFFILKS
jgi:hypothetical protein